MYQLAKSLMLCHIVAYAAPSESGTGGKSFEDVLEKPSVKFQSTPVEIPTKEARNRFAKVLQKAEEDNSFVVTHHGRPLAAIIGVEKYRVLDYLEAIGWVDELEKTADKNVSKEEFKAKLKSLCDIDL